MKIKIVFTKPKNKILPIGSYLIRLYQKTGYSHVALIFQTSRGKKLVYEAVGSGIRYISKNKWLENVIVVESFELEISAENYIQIIDYCIENAGYDYGFMQNIGIAVAEIFNLKKNPFKKGKNCSEVLAEVLVKNGFDVTKPLDLVTPKDINDILVSRDSES